MPHSTAIDAFQRIANDQQSSLLARLYSSLVILELAAKDHIYSSNQKWPGGHQVTAFLNSVDGTLSSNCTQLHTALGKLICTNLKGAESTVNAGRYPDIRYLRHSSDAPPWPNSSTDATLTDALNIVQVCLNHLRKTKILK
jgi:hypothetical protein